jgi:hypothetical protein
MANTQTSVPVFTTGQVLTAAQQNQINTGIPVFADSTARDAAFGGTGEKTLAEGQFAFLEDTDATQYYSGSSWEALGVAPGLVLINSTAFNAVTEVSLPNDTFSASYENYKITISINTVVSAANITGRFRTAGSDNTTSNYQTMFLGITQNATETNETGTSETSFLLGETGTQARSGYSFDVLQPFATLTTEIVGNYSCRNTANNGSITRTGGAQFSQTTSFDSFTLISSVADNISGTIRAYGYANS